MLKSPNAYPFDLLQVFSLTFLVFDIMQASKEHIPFVLSPWPYTLPIWVLVVSVYGIENGYHYIGLLLAFVVIPVIDIFVKLDVVNPTKAMERQLHDDTRYRAIVMIWVPLQIGVIVYALHGLFIRDLYHSNAELVLTAISLSAMGAVGMTVAHELIHKKTWLEYNLGRLLLAAMFYEHFTIEHIQGHHKRVSTPEDPTSAPLGMHPYKFIVRSVVYSLKHAWELDWAFVAWGFVRSTLFFGFLVYQIVPPEKYAPACAVLAMYVVGCISFLEIINYIEHYGLERSKLPNGEYEPVSQFHSWNSSHSVSNFLLYKLQRHSDHHAVGGKRYQLLRTYPESPHLPYGYPTMVLIAGFAPSTFMRMIDPLVKESRKLAKEHHLKGSNPFTPAK